MKNNDGNISYGVELDLSGLEKQAQETSRVFQGITDKAQASGKKVDSAFSEASSGATSSMKKIGAEAERQAETMNDAFSSAASSIGKAMAAMGIAATLQEFGAKVMQVRGEFQKLEVAFEVMLGSAEKADALMQQLTQTAATTPFDLQGVANGAKQLLAYGTAAEDVNDTLVRLGNLAAGLSIPLGDLVMLYGTTQTQGRLFTQDLRQFMGRGIPLARELAKQFGVAESEVGELVTAGKVGFPEVEKAIRAMTSEGGQFAGLMEKQSKTIAGQISNIEDSIDTMFNEIGKNSEGLISGALGAVSTLIENYQKIGEAIFFACEAYGVYKGILITVAAIQKAQNALLAQAVLEKNLAAAAGITLSNAEAIAAAKTKMLAIAQQGLAKALKSAATAALANPYVLATAAVVGLTYAIYKLVTAESVEEKGVRRANDEIERQEKLMDEREQKMKELIGTIQDESASVIQQAQAYEKLKAIAPSITDAYTQQQIAVMSAADAQNAMNEVLDAATHEQLKKNVEDTTKKIKELGEELSMLSKQNVSSSAEAMGRSAQVSELYARIEQAKIELREYKGQLYEFEKAAKAAQEANQPLEIRIENARQTLIQARDVFNQVETEMIAEQEKVRDNPWYQIPVQLIFDWNSAKQAFNEAKSAYDQISAVANQSHAEAQKAAMDNYNKAVKEEIKARGKSETEWREAKKNLDAAKSALQAEDITLKTTGSRTRRMNRSASDTANRAEQIRSIQEKINEMLKQQKEDQEQQARDIQNQIAQAEIEALEDGLEKTLRAREHANKMEIEALEKQREDYKKAYIAQEKELFDAREDLAKAQDKKYQKKTFDPSSVSVDTSAYDRLIELARSKQAKTRADAERDAMNEYLREYGTYQEKRKAISEYYSREILRAETEGQKKALEEQSKRALSDLDMEELKRSIDWEDVFSDMANHSVKYLEMLRQKLQEALNAKDITEENAKILSEKINEITAQITSKGNIWENILPGLGQRKALEKMLKTAQEQGDTAKAGNIKDKLSNMGGLSDVFGFMSGGPMAMMEGINKNVQSLSSLVDTIGVGDTEFGEAVHEFADGTGAFMGAIQSLASGDVFGAINGVIKGFQSWGSMLGIGNGSNAAEVAKITEENTRANERLTASVEKLKDSIDKTNGMTAVSDYKKAMEAQEKIVENQREILEAQMGYHGAHHSNAYYWHLDTSDIADLNKTLEEYARRNGKNRSVVNGKLDSILALSPEELDYIRTNLPKIWQKMLDQGKYDKSEYWDAFADLAGKAQEITDQINENLTQISFASLRDDFVSTLMDMDADSSDFADKFTEYMTKSLLNMSIGDILDSEIRDWYNSWATRLQAGNLTEEEIAEYKREWDDMVRRGIEQRDAIASLTGYDKNSRYQQEASSRGWQAMGQDTAEELNGRFTAIQIETVKISELVQLQAQDIARMANTASESSSVLMEMSNLIFISNGYLERIAKNSAYLPDMDAKLQRIIENTN